MSTRPVQWPGDDESKPAPEPLRLVQALVNTVELPEGLDRLADHANARPWLVDNKLLGPDSELTNADLALVHAVREALRVLLVHNAGGPPPTEAALAPLRAVAATGAARPSLASDGAVQLTTTGGSVRDRLVGVLLIVRDAQRDRTWPLLKACANDQCRWAFYDKSRNHGGIWCEMSVCGNKLKNRAFRARSKAR